MPLRNFRPKTLVLAAAPVILVAVVLRGPTAPDAGSMPPPRAVVAFPPTLTPSAVPTATAVPPTASPVPPTATAQAQPEPTPSRTNVRVGLQAGHWKSSELPDELKRLRTSSGTVAGGVTEAQVNLDITQRVAELLRQRGIEVDVLPATVPPQYDADVFVAIHADGSQSTKSRGFKLATPWRTSAASQHLLDALTTEYAAATDMPRDGAITMNMRGYYAFSWRRHQHATAKTTPAVILEMGFLTNATDRAFLTQRQSTVAIGIANGIIRYLNERDPNDTAALMPPDFKTQRSASPDGVAIRASPSDTAKVLFHAAADRRLFPFQERNGWFQVFVRGSANMLGWVRRDQLLETNEPDPTPPPATDS